MTPSDQPTDADLDRLRRTFAMAGAARAAGKHPFAAMVVDEQGTVWSEAGNNSLPPDGDPTQHAEVIAAAQAARRLTPERLARCTLYTSAEPCCMCAGAVYWCNIGRVVYGLSEKALLGITGNHAENPTLSLSCRTMFASGQRAIRVTGPLLEDEAAEVHRGFWK